MSRWIKVNISLVTHSAGSLLDYKEYYKNKSNKGVTDTLSQLLWLGSPRL